MNQNAPNPQNYYSYLVEQLNTNSYAHTLNHLAELVQDDPAGFDFLWELAFGENETIAMRASAVMERIARKFPDTFESRQVEIIQAFKQDLPNGLARNLLKGLRYISYQEKNSGFLLNYCLDIIQSNQPAPAIKVYAMDIVWKIIQDYPELIVEFQIIMEQQVHSEIPSIAAHTRNMIKQMNTFQKKQLQKPSKHD